jgi:hypothetical protein
MHIPTDREKKKNEVLGIMTIEYGFITAHDHFPKSIHQGAADQV